MPLTRIAEDAEKIITGLSRSLKPLSNGVPSESSVLIIRQTASSNNQNGVRRNYFWSLSDCCISNTVNGVQSSQGPGREWGKTHFRPFSFIIRRCTSCHRTVSTIFNRLSHSWWRRPGPKPSYQRLCRQKNLSLRTNTP